MHKSRITVLIFLSLLLLATQYCGENPVGPNIQMTTGGKVAYISLGGYYDGPWMTRIFICNLDGSDPVLIHERNNEDRIAQIQFSPDGYYFIYQPDYHHINIVDMATMETTTIFENTEHSIMDISISPNSKKLVFSNGYDIVEVDLATGDSHIMTAGLTASGNTCFSPQYSPDGVHLMFTLHTSGSSPFHIYTMTVEGKNARHISSGKWGRYNGDGSKIIYTNHFGSNEVSNLYVVNSGGSSVKAMEPAGNRKAADFSFTPDGKYALYQKSDVYYHPADIYRLDLNSLAEENVTASDDLSEGNPVISPNGNDIFFVLDRSMVDGTLINAKVMRVNYYGDVRELMFEAEDIFAITIQSIF